jgi:hypothetical protein
MQSKRWAADAIRRTLAGSVDDVSKSSRSVTARINTACVDRYQTVIVPSGGDLRRYRSTPAVLWEHGQDPTRGRVPIGRCLDVRYRRSEDDILATTRFNTDEYSDRVFQNYVDGTLTSFSVDFIPSPAASSAPTRAELDKRPDWAGAMCIYRKWELSGLSSVSYPGNPEALAIAVERGLWVCAETRSILDSRRQRTSSTLMYRPHTQPARRTVSEPEMQAIAGAVMAAALIAIHSGQERQRRLSMDPRWSQLSCGQCQTRAEYERWCKDQEYRRYDQVQALREARGHKAY